MPEDRYQVHPTNGPLQATCLHGIDKVQFPVVVWDRKPGWGERDRHLPQSRRGEAGRRRPEPLRRPGRHVRLTMDRPFYLYAMGNRLLLMYGALPFWLTSFDIAHLAAAERLRDSLNAAAHRHRERPNPLLSTL